LIVGGGLLMGVGFVSIRIISLLTSGRPVPLVGVALETGASRLILYRNSLNLWGDYFLTGMGLGDVFAMIYSRYQLLIRVPFLTYTHNLYLTVALGLGLLGLIALIWLVVSFYSFVIRLELSGHLSKRSLPIFRAAWLGVTVIFLHGLTDASQFSAPGWTMPMLFALLGLTLLAGRAAVRQTEPSEPGGRVQPVAVILAIFAIGLIVAGILFWRPLLSIWYANLGAVYQTRSDLSPQMDDFEREVASDQAIAYFAKAMDLEPNQAVANRRFGLMALDKQVFDVAVAYLERAYRQEPHNQATLKGLGLAYLWTGQLDRAGNLLGQIDDQEEIIEELGTWQWWWGTQERDDLSQNAAEMQWRLARKD
jgi:tetratricopeptide (TPR) repeat protein